MYASTSAACALLSEPGAVCGIVVRMRLRRSTSGTPSHVELNWSPTSGGAASAPSSVSPWQGAQFVWYRPPPRLACSAVYTPSHTVGGACPATDITRTVAIEHTEITK